MTVKELIEELESLPTDIPIYFMYDAIADVAIKHVDADELVEEAVLIYKKYD